MARRWHIAVGAALLASIFAGSLSGVGAFTFIYAKGGSYLTNDPAACANCHVMQGHYDAWLKSSHRHVAACNDCHAPHDLLGKYWVKAENGFWHSWAFTTGWFHEPIQIRDKNLRVTEQACLDCHQDIVRAMHAGRAGEAVSCIRCHGAVGHMR